MALCGPPQLLRMQLKLQHVLDVIGALIHFGPSRNAMRSAFASRSKPEDKPMGFFSKLRDSRRIGLALAEGAHNARQALPICIIIAREAGSFIAHLRCLSTEPELSTPVHNATLYMIKSYEYVESTNLEAADSCKELANELHENKFDASAISTLVTAVYAAIDRAREAHKCSDNDFNRAHADYDFVTVKHELKARFPVSALFLHVPG